MGWLQTQTREADEKRERKSGTNWWYIAGVAIGAGTG